MEANSTLVTAALLGAAAVVGAVIKPLLDLLRGKKNGADHTMGHQIRDLHEWHRPDALGRQSWRGTEIKEAIETNRKSTQQNFDRLHSANEKIEEAIHEATNTMRDGLKEVVQAIRDQERPL